MATVLPPPPLEQGAALPGEPAAGPDAPAPTATLVIGTHAAAESDLAATVTSLGSHGFVSAVTSVLRVEGA